MNLLFYLFENQNHNVHFLNILVSFNFMIAICKANNFFEENIMLSSWLCKYYADEKTIYFPIEPLVFIVSCSISLFLAVGNVSILISQNAFFFKYLYTYPLS